MYACKELRPCVLWLHMRPPSYTRRTESGLELPSPLDWLTGRWYLATWFLRWIPWKRPGGRIFPEPPPPGGIIEVVPDVVIWEVNWLHYLNDEAIPCSSSTYPVFSLFGESVRVCPYFLQTDLHVSPPSYSLRWCCVVCVSIHTYGIITLLHKCTVWRDCNRMYWRENSIGPFVPNLMINFK